MRSFPEVDRPCFAGQVFHIRPRLLVCPRPIAAGVFYAIEGWTEGLLLVIVILLAGILFLLATKHR